MLQDAIQSHRLIVTEGRGDGKRKLHPSKLKVLSGLYALQVSAKSTKAKSPPTKETGATEDVSNTLPRISKPVDPQTALLPALVSVRKSPVRATPSAMSAPTSRTHSPPSQRRIQHGASPPGTRLTGAHGSSQPLSARMTSSSLDGFWSSVLNK